MQILPRTEPPRLWTNTANIVLKSCSGDFTGSLRVPFTDTVPGVSVRTGLSTVRTSTTPAGRRGGWRTLRRRRAQQAVGRNERIPLGPSPRCCCCYNDGHQWKPHEKPVPTLHLNQELCLDSARSLALVLTSRTAQRVDLVNEDDGGFVLSGELEQVLNQPKRE